MVLAGLTADTGAGNWKSPCARCTSSRTATTNSRSRCWHESKCLAYHYIAEALKSPDELQHECTTVHLLEVRYLLKHAQDGAVMTQVLELLEHEQPPLLLASFLTGHGVRLTRGTTIVNVASRQASDVDVAQVTVDSRGRVLGGEDLRHGSIGVETTSA